MEITKKELDKMRARRSQADLNLIFTWLRDEGEIRIVDEVPVASRDANLEEWKDADVQRKIFPPLEDTRV
jgi:hypothetical protein